MRRGHANLPCIVPLLVYVLLMQAEGISQSLCMNDSWTWTMETGLTVGERDGLGAGKQKRKNWDNCNRINNKKMKWRKKRFGVSTWFLLFRACLEVLAGERSYSYYTLDQRPVLSSSEGRPPLPLGEVVLFHRGPCVQLQDRRT